MLKDSKKQTIGLIGRVGVGKALFDGQTVKTRNMLKVLQEQYGKDSIFVVDTVNWRYRIPKIIIDTKRCFRSCDDIVVLLSINGRRALFPLLSRAVQKRGTHVYHNLFGGWLASNLNEYPQWVDYLNSFKVNWVETHRLANDLAVKGVVNVEYLPNFKYLEVPEIPERRSYRGAWRFCTFSRVVEQKGVGDAMKAVEILNDCCDTDGYRLDIYGPIDSKYCAVFYDLLRKCPHSTYKGSVPAEKSVGTIVDYDALLFPTKWKLEGVPGTVIDALAAGVPIIGAHWQYYDEILTDGITGLGYEFGRNDLLPDAIRRFVEFSDNNRNAMRRACLDRAEAYKPEKIADEIRRKIGR